MKKPIKLDTNSIIYLIIDDPPEFAEKTAMIIVLNDCCIPIEVIAEVVYTLRDRYNFSRDMITQRLKDLIEFKDNLVENENVVRFGLREYASTNLDFIDCLLIGYARTQGNPIFTFDKDLKKCLGEKVFND